MTKRSMQRTRRADRRGGVQWPGLLLAALLSTGALGSLKLLQDKDGNAVEPQKRFGDIQQQLDDTRARYREIVSQPIAWVEPKCKHEDEKKAGTPVKPQIIEPDPNKKKTEDSKKGAPDSQGPGTQQPAAGSTPSAPEKAATEESAPASPAPEAKPAEAPTPSPAPVFTRKPIFIPS